MPYYYGREEIAAAVGLSGVQAEHIAQALKAKDIDPQAIDWAGAMSDAKDYGNRYEAVKNYLAKYYGVILDKPQVQISSEIKQYREQDLDYHAATKEGVRLLLKDYFNPSVAKRDKELIKDALLADQATYNVLMVSLYNGTTMPLAKKFLNEQLGMAAAVPKPQAKILPEIPKKSVSPTPTPTPEPTPKPTRQPTHVEKQLFRLYKRSLDVGSRYGVKTGRWVKKEALSTGGLFAASAKSLVRRKTPAERMLEQKKQVEQMRLELMPLQLQVERERLHTQMQQIRMLRGRQRQQEPGVVGDFLRAFAPQMVMQPQRRRPEVRDISLFRPGYHIEYGPKLPKGYRWIKDKPPKAPKVNIPKNLKEHKFPTFPQAQTHQRDMAMKYGYVPEIFRVTGHGKMFFLIVEPKGLKRVR